MPMAPPAPAIDNNFKAAQADIIAGEAPKMDERAMTTTMTMKARPAFCDLETAMANVRETGAAVKALPNGFDRNGVPTPELAAAQRAHDDAVIRCNDLLRQAGPRKPAAAAMSAAACKREEERRIARARR